MALGQAARCVALLLPRSHVGEGLRSMCVSTCCSGGDRAGRAMRSAATPVLPPAEEPRGGGAAVRVLYHVLQPHPWRWLPGGGRPSCVMHGAAAHVLLPRSHVCINHVPQPWLVAARWRYGGGRAMRGAATPLLLRGVPLALCIPIFQLLLLSPSLLCNLLLLPP